MLLSDFCVEPIRNTMLVLPPGTSQNITSFYLTCTGANPTQEYIDASYSAISSMNSTINYLLDNNVCPLAINELNYVQQNLTISYQILNDITFLSSCPPIQSELSSFLENTTCYQLFVGMYIVWICQYVISGTTFLVLITASIIYHYFGRYWNMKQEDLDLLTNDLEVGLVPSGHHPSSLYGAQSTPSYPTNSNNTYVANNTISYNAPVYAMPVTEEAAVNPMQTVKYSEGMGNNGMEEGNQVTNPMLNTEVLVEDRELRKEDVENRNSITTPPYQNVENRNSITTPPHQNAISDRKSNDNQIELNVTESINSNNNESNEIPEPVIMPSAALPHESSTLNNQE